MAPSEGLGRFGGMTEGERRLERLEHSLLCCLLFSFVLSSGNKLLLKSAWEGKKWIESAMARRKRETGGGGDRERQTVYPPKQIHAPSLLSPHLSPLAHRTHLFSTLPYQDQMDPTVFPCIPSSQPPPLLPTTFLLPFSPWLRSFMTPHGFCHSVVSGKEREIPSRVSISAGKEWGFDRVRALGTQTGLSLPPTAPFPLFSISCLFAWLTFSLLLVCGFNAGFLL